MSSNELSGDEFEIFFDEDYSERCSKGSNDENEDELLNEEIDRFWASEDEEEEEEDFDDFSTSIDEEETLLVENNEEFPELDEGEIREARQASLDKFASSLRSICERYDRPFEDGDEIDMMSLQVIVDRGYLRNASHCSVFGKGIDEQLVKMIEKRQVIHHTTERCKRCHERFDDQQGTIYCDKCKEELRERRSLMSWMTTSTTTPTILPTAYSSPIRSYSVSSESSFLYQRQQQGGGEGEQREPLSSPSQLSGKTAIYYICGL
jgi:hypothetical protein